VGAVVSGEARAFKERVGVGWGWRGQPALAGTRMPMKLASYYEVAIVLLQLLLLRDY